MMIIFRALFFKKFAPLFAVLPVLSCTQVFMKEWLGYQLDELKNSLMQDAVLKLQRYMRGFLTRKQYEKMKKSSVVVQAAVRGWIAKYVSFKLLATVRRLARNTTDPQTVLG